jgi:protein-S-isoprenylcysteine O-methyltransferase Ste14
MNLPSKLGIIFFISEVLLRFSHRSREHGRADGGSLALLWIAIAGGLVGAVMVSLRLPVHGFPLPHLANQVVGFVFVGGLLLRWWAIISLGRFFTVDVSIAPDHELIVRGPYHVIRHPSYAGLLVAFLALGVTFQNWLSLVCLMGPILLALAYRIFIEERALGNKFGEEYFDYKKTTKRLIPGVF